MSETSRCSKFGAELSPDASQCPKCFPPFEVATLQADVRTEALHPVGSPASGPSEATLLLIGSPFGHYLIHRRLGKGGMGEVYEAEDPETGRVVALKILNERLSSATDRKRFLREGRLAAQVTHPNVVCVFGTEEIEGTLTISFELVPGRTLLDHVAERGPLPVTEAVGAILQIIGGLEVAVDKGVLHRDIFSGHSE